jgi:hypothetical protein
MLPWPVVWAGVVAAVIALLGGLEVAYRSAGLRPSVTHTQGLWAFHRARANGNEGRVLALVGASRVQLAFSLPVFRQRFPSWRVVQLGLPGTGPVATLEHLASDPMFSGVALVSANGRWLDRSTWADQRDVVDEYDAGSMLRQSIVREVMRAAVQSQLTFTASGLGAWDLISGWIENGAFPTQRYVTMDFDRSRGANFSRLDDLDIDGRLERLRELYAKTSRSLDAWLQGTAELDSAVEAIQRRGGNVVFVQFPTTGRVDALLESYFPKASAWDVFARQTAAAALHFKDVAALRSYECPDQAHLDMRDKPAFTRALLDALVEGEVLPAE